MFTNSFRCLKQWKLRMQRRQWRRSGKNWRKSRHGSWRKSETRKKWSKKQIIRAEKFILRHCWICVIFRIRSCNLSIINTKAGSYSEVTLWTMILVRMQCSLNKDHQHLKWQPQKARTLSRLPGCAGQAADAVSAHTQVKLEDAPKLLKSPKLECPDILDTSTETQMEQIMVHSGRNSWSSWAQSVWSSFGKTVMGKAIWENPIEVRLGEGFNQNWECLFVHREKGLFLSVYVDDIKLAGKTENIEPTWKILMEDVDLGERTSFLDHVFLGCTQRECKISNDIVANYRDMFESRISAGLKENLRIRETWCRNNIFLVLWHGRSRKEMCGNILRTCE